MDLNVRSQAHKLNVEFERHIILLTNFCVRQDVEPHSCNIRVTCSWSTAGYIAGLLVLNKLLCKAPAQVRTEGEVTLDHDEA